MNAFVEQLEVRQVLSRRTLTGVIFQDTNGDGSRQGNESGVNGRAVQLLNSQGVVVQQTTTTTTGAYKFRRLADGDYTIRPVLPDGWTQTGGEASVSASIGKKLRPAGNNVGIFELGTISGVIDVDGPPGQDEGLAGWTVQLVNADHDVVAETTTDLAGNYTFTDLEAGTYTVRQVLPDGWLPGSGPQSYSVTIKSGTDSIRNSFSNFKALSLSGYVYIDAGNDGVRTDDTGIADTVITLTGKTNLGADVILTATTDEFGYYEFTGLRPSDASGYTLTETQPDGFFDGIDTAGTPGGSVINDGITSIVLGSNANGSDFNFGELKAASISGYVFADANNNGLLEDEDGLSEVMVRLDGRNDLGETISVTAMTNSSGFYRFTNLRPGSYTVTEFQPNDFLDGKESTGSLGGIIGDDQLGTILLPAEIDAVNYNFGELRPASLSGSVYVDANNDGTRQPSESGIAGVGVTLAGINDLGAAVSLSMTTDANGDYTFTGLRPGIYVVTESQIDGYLDGREGSGSSGGTVASDVIGFIHLDPGSDSVDYNFGELLPSSLSGSVYLDENNDGTLQHGEAPVSGVTVTLTGTDDRGSVRRTTTTDSNGHYNFGNLRPGIYTITEAQPGEYLDGKESEGTIAATVGSDLLGGIVLASGTDGTGNNFGELSPASLSGYVYVDANNDGTRQLNETPIAGVTVKLTGTDDLGDEVTLSTKTNASGAYTFGNLRPGSYVVTETGPSGYLDGKDSSGSVDGAVSNDVISQIELLPGLDGVDVNFGEVIASSLSGYVYVDSNSNGVKEQGETPISGVIIALTGTNDLGAVSLSTSTNASGFYSFGNLRPGTYTITETQPTGNYLDGQETIGSQGGTVGADKFTQVVVVSGTTGTNNNFSEHLPGTIGGTVFQDSDGDGVLDNGEAGIAGFTVQLRDSHGTVVQQVVTTASGVYSFSNLTPGNYSVTETIPSGWINSSAQSFSVHVATDSVLTANFGNRPGILITNAWLQAQGSSGPFLLSQANTTYQLDTDITVDGTAFVIGAANVVLDLNGHTVTYGNSAPVTVTNGGFEQGTGSNVPGWDLSAAAGAVLLPARLGMWGSNMLEVPNFTTQQTIISDPITIPVAGREYAAAITPKGTSGSTATISVIDAVTGQVLGTASSKSVDRGYSAVATFSTTNPVRLKIDLIPPANTTATIDLDYASIFTYQDYGVMASPSVWNYPDQLQTTQLTNAGKKTNNFTVRNGSLIQGQGQAYGGSAVNAVSLVGLNIDNVYTFVNGMDTMNVDAIYAKNITITNSTFEGDVDIISNRKKVFGAINLVNNVGNILIDHNTIINSPQVGIVASNNTGGTLTITNNSISQRAVVANAYGIMMSGVQQFVVANNSIITDNGRGISLDSWDSANSDTGDIYGNYVDVQVSPNLEYGESFMVAAAMRIRNYNGAQRNVHIHDNTFVASTGLGQGQTATGLRIEQLNALGQMNDANNVIENNIFRAIVNTTDSKYHAWAVSISGVDAGTGLIFRNNDFQSNEVSLQLGDDANYRGSNADISFVGNTYTRLNAGAARAYAAVQVGDSQNAVSNMRLIGNTYVNNLTPPLKFLGNALKDVAVGWLLTVAVTNGSSIPVINAVVQLYDTTGALVFSGTTDDFGRVRDIQVITQTYKQLGSDPKVINTVNNGPFRLTVTSNGNTVEQTVALSANTTVSIEI